MKTEVSLNTFQDDMRSNFSYEGSQALFEYLNDLENFIPENNINFFPSSFNSIKNIEDINNDNLLIRNEVLSEKKDKKRIIITYPEAVSEKLISKKIIENKTQKISIGDKLSIEFINEHLIKFW